MADWQGIVADTTDVDETPGASMQQLNTRMRVSGELQRRQGFLAAFPPMGGPILSIAGGNGFIVSAVEGGIVDGASDPVGVLIGPIVFPPVIQQLPQGGRWQVSINGLTGINAQFPAFSCAGVSSCGGAVLIRRLAGRVSGGSFAVWRQDGFGSLGWIESGVYGTEVGVTAVTVPFSATHPHVYVGIDDTYGPVAVYQEESKSDAGCGPEWTIFRDPTVWGVITQVHVQNAYDCSGGGKCPGTISLNFSSVTAPNATVIVFRALGGVTSIFDNRVITSGSNYDVQVPSSSATGTELPQITVQISPNGGTVTGSLTGRAKPGC